ncbi:hypothetical protein [Methanolobus sp. ZRKC5]|uniref:hypothetical protein n=1 Tax=Methanolobus sp. ZRKC5 TaxID=3136295 RepID=UPI00313A94C1
MDITIFYLGALFFGSVAIFNAYSTHKYGESYLPAIVSIMVFFSLLLLIILPWQYGYVAFMLTMIFSIVNYRKSYRINKGKMRQYIEDSRSTESLKLTDYFTGWKLIHHLNRRYGPNKASLIYSLFMWLFGILLIILVSHLWPDIFSNIWYVAFIMTTVMFGFYWQNKKLLESLNKGDFRQAKNK